MDSMAYGKPSIVGSIKRDDRRLVGSHPLHVTWTLVRRSSSVFAPASCPVQQEQLGSARRAVVQVGDTLECCDPLCCRLRAACYRCGSGRSHMFVYLGTGRMAGPSTTVWAYCTFKAIPAVQAEAAGSSSC